VTAFLGELSSKLADRWAATLVAPGLLYLTVVTLAVWLGQGQALDLAAVRSHVNGIAASPGSHATGTVLIAAVGVLAGSVGASLAAAVVGKLVERAWLLPGTRPPLRLVRRWRERRWAAATQRIEQSASSGEQPSDDSPGLDLAAIAARSKAAIARRDAIALVSPERPTWIGDRLRAVDVRVWAAYRLDLTVAWPHLWSMAAPRLRTDLSAAQDSYSGAARLAGWGLLCLAVAPWWWPAAIVATIILGTAWSNARTATETLASLAETATDLHGRRLAAKLGIPCPGPLTADIGQEIMTQLRKA
jgi:hypothetical protein